MTEFFLHVFRICPLAARKLPLRLSRLKLICTLRFADGQCVIAILKIDSPQQECPINYEGAVERLPWRPPSGDPLDFKVIFRSLAREHHAQMEVQEEGDYAAPRPAATKRTKPATIEDLIRQREFWSKFDD